MPRRWLIPLLAVSLAGASCGESEGDALVDAVCADLAGVSDPEVRHDLIVERGMDLSLLDFARYLVDLKEQCPDEPDWTGDMSLVAGLFEGLNASWDLDREETIAFIVEHNHPDLGLNRDDFGCLLIAPDGYRHEVTPVALRLDPTWRVSNDFGTGIDGMVPTGRIYEVKVRERLVAPGQPDYASESTLHVAIIGQEAFFFIADTSCLAVS